MHFGCERKLQRVLFRIAGVHNVQTSLVFSQAEFDVDVLYQSIKSPRCSRDRPNLYASFAWKVTSLIGRSLNRGFHTGVSARSNIEAWNYGDSL